MLYFLIFMFEYNEHSNIQSVHLYGRGPQLCSAATATTCIQFHCWHIRWLRKRELEHWSNRISTISTADPGTTGFELRGSAYMCIFFQQRYKKYTCRTLCTRQVLKWLAYPYTGIRWVIFNKKLIMCSFSYSFTPLLSKNYITIQHAPLS